MKVVYSLKARQDLIDIMHYIAFELLSPEAAHHTAGRIMEAVRSLAVMPERNPLYKEEPWRSLGIRFVPAQNYLVFYMVDAETVSVVRILYGGRDVSRQLGETGR